MAKEEYRFKVEQNGIVKMQTNEEACMYNKEIRNEMREAINDGYRYEDLFFKWDKVNDEETLI